LKDLEYAAATSVDEAVSLLAAQGEGAQILAGGTDVLAQWRDRPPTASLIVDVKKIPELVEIRYSAAEGLRLGAAVPCSRLYRDTIVAAAYPGLIDAARIIGGWQIQSRASIGGNLCNASPAADSIPALIAYDVACELAGPSGRRRVPAGQFCTAPGKSVLTRGEILTALLFPPQSRSSAAYQRFIPRNEMDIAAAGAGSWVRLDESGRTIVEARIGLAAVAPRPVSADEAANWLAGKPAEENTYAQAGELAKRAASPISDKRGTAEYRTHLVGVLTRRTLALAVERARGQQNGRASHRG
jgi:carbon-monoxide dehydrogenase medium subunit